MGLSLVAMPEHVFTLRPGRRARPCSTKALIAMERLAHPKVEDVGMPQGQRCSTKAFFETRSRSSDDHRAAVGGLPSEIGASAQDASLSIFVHRRRAGLQIKPLCRA